MDCCISPTCLGASGPPSELFTVGDKAEVTVLKYDRETGRISLGLKQKPRILGPMSLGNTLSAPEFEVGWSV